MKNRFFSALRRVQRAVGTQTVGTQNISCPTDAASALLLSYTQREGALENQASSMMEGAAAAAQQQQLSAEAAAALASVNSAAAVGQDPVTATLAAAAMLSSASSSSSSSSSSSNISPTVVGGGGGGLGLIGTVVTGPLLSRKPTSNQYEEKLLHYIVERRKSGRPLDGACGRGRTSRL